jgi:hypothetical protein
MEKKPEKTFCSVFQKCPCTALGTRFKTSNCICEPGLKELTDTFLFLFELFFNHISPKSKEMATNNKINASFFITSIELLAIEKM